MAVVTEYPFDHSQMLDDPLRPFLQGCHSHSRDATCPASPKTKEATDLDFNSLINVSAAASALICCDAILPEFPQSLSLSLRYDVSILEPGALPSMVCW